MSTGPRAAPPMRSEHDEAGERKIDREAHPDRQNFADKHRQQQHIDGNQQRGGVGDQREDGGADKAHEGAQPELPS